MLKTRGLGAFSTPLAQTRTARWGKAEGPRLPVVLTVVPTPAPDNLKCLLDSSEDGWGFFSPFANGALFAANAAHFWLDIYIYT